MQLICLLLQAESRKRDILKVNYLLQQTGSSLKMHASQIPSLKAIPSAKHEAQLLKGRSDSQILRLFESVA